MGLTRKDALDCFHSDDLIGIGMEADAVRRRLHPEGVVTYTIDGTIDYNQAANGAASESAFEKISKLVAQGATAITLQGQITPAHTITWFETLFRAIKQRFPALWLHSLSATEILAIAKLANSSPQDTIARLRDAGLDSIPSNDAGILDDAVNRQCKAEDWIAVHRAAHTLGIQTTATMTFGSGESFEQRINHLDTLLQLQEETNGFTSFTPLSFVPQNFVPQNSAGNGFEEATAVEYLKTLAISRMYLDNIVNVQSNLETQGPKVLQVALRFGGNDLGSVLLAKEANSATEEQLRQIIRDAGFRPVQRDTLYRSMFLN